MDKLKEQYKIINGDSLEVLDTIPENSIDAIITDPPYELGFMGKSWDASGIAYNVELWKKALKVLKPGGYLLAFGGTRTFHRIACAIEDGGFEIRDTIMWLYGSGFPKSMDIGKSIEGKLVLGSGNVKDIKKLDGEKTIVSGGWNSNEVEQGKRNKEYVQTKTNVNFKTEEGKKWSGWGTCLKPAYEPIIVARKPFKGSLVDNVLEYGVGGLNIDGCRIPLKGDETIATNVAFKEQKQSEGWGTKRCITEQTEQGRFPANIIHDGSEEATAGMPIGGQNGSIAKPYDMNNRVYGKYGQCNTWEAYQDSGSAARYFYCAKASSKDRDEGLNGFDVVNTGELQGGRKDGTAGSIMKNADGTTRVNPYAGTGAPKKNIHPTVKPTELMQYLVRLVAPKGATILDIFNGSGSTGKAVAFENREREMNYSYIGIELDPEYCKISEARIDYVLNKYKYDILDEQEDNKKKGQMSLFDDYE